MGCKSAIDVIVGITKIRCAERLTKCFTPLNYAKSRIEESVAKGDYCNATYIVAVKPAMHFISRELSSQFQFLSLENNLNLFGIQSLISQQSFC